MQKKLNDLKKHLRAGRVYRRSELGQYSNAVDRHIRQLLEEGVLLKVAAGVYYCPKRTVFGVAPADARVLVKAFLKDDRFLVTSPNAYNGLGLGMTQLYNETVVYNHKRHGLFMLGNRVFDFRVKPSFPKRVSKEFLLVDLVNNLDSIIEDKTQLLDRIKAKVSEMDAKVLSKAVCQYGNVRSQKFFKGFFAQERLIHAR